MPTKLTKQIDDLTESLHRVDSQRMLLRDKLAAVDKLYEDLRLANERLKKQIANQAKSVSDLGKQALEAEQRAKTFEFAYNTEKTRREQAQREKQWVVDERNGTVEKLEAYVAKLEKTRTDQIKKIIQCNQTIQELEQKCDAWVWQDKYEDNNIHSLANNAKILITGDQIRKLVFGTKKDATAILESIDERLTSIERKVR